MFTRFVGIALICSTLLAGCVTTTTKTTCVGPICGTETTTNTDDFPSQHHADDDGDATGAVITAAAVITALALTVFFIKHKNDDDNESANRSQHRAMTDEELRLERMYAQAHLSARAGRCEAVIAISKKLAVDSPAEYERFTSDRELSACLPRNTVSLR
jgi:hypothetical protein